MAITLKTLEADIAAAERNVYAADARAATAGRELRAHWQSKVPALVGGAGLLVVARQMLKRRPRVQKRGLRERVREIPSPIDAWGSVLRRYLPFVSVVPQVIAVASALIAAFAAKDAKKSLTSAAQVDLDRFAGSWFEIARLPERGEKDCGADSRVTYARTDSGLRILSLCRLSDGSVRRVTARAKLRDDATQSRFKISYLSPALDALPFVWSDYTIVDVADDYSSAIVGKDNRKQLWLLAKTPTVDDKTRQDFLNTARAQGFDTSALVFTPQNEPAKPSQPAPAFT